MALALPVPAAGWWPSKLTLRTPNYPADTHACVRARACAHAHEQLRRLSPHADGIEFCSYPIHVQLAMHAIDAVPAALAVDHDVVVHVVARRQLGAAAGRRLPPPRRHNGPSRHSGTKAAGTQELKCVTWMMHTRDKSEGYPCGVHRLMRGMRCSPPYRSIHAIKVRAT